MGLPSLPSWKPALKCKKIAVDSRAFSIFSYFHKEINSICLTVYFSWSSAGRRFNFISSSTAPKQNNHFISSSMKVTSIYLGEAPMLAYLQSPVGSPLFSAPFGYCILVRETLSPWQRKHAVILMNGVLFQCHSSQQWAISIAIKMSDAK